MDQVRRGIDAVPVVAVDFARGVQVVHSLVEDHGRVGQRAIDHGFV
jgi:hypothetical protein